MKFLTFTLAGPLSSYGEMERWDHRGTGEMPTKSAVIGLLGCCMGLPRGDAGLRRLDEALRMAVRRDRAGSLLTDFQTVQGQGGVILNALRKPRGSTIITPKQYLQGAAFQVFLYGDEAVLAECAAAMRHPRWVVGLGRSSCPPSVPLLPEWFEAESVTDALATCTDTAWQRLNRKKVAAARESGRERQAELWRERLLAASVRCEIECEDGLDARALTGAYHAVRHDAIIRADENRYEDRQVVSGVIRRDAACI